RHACLGRPLARLGEHRRRAVDPKDRADRLRDRNGDAAVADRKLDHRPVGLSGELDVEGDVLGHVRGPVVVDLREGVVSAHEGRCYSRPMDPQALETEGQSASADAESPAELEEARVRYVGRKSELAQALRAVRDRETGMTLNGVRDRLEASLES